MSYSMQFESARGRAKDFMKNWFFSCSCARCLDPTDLGWHSGTWLCPLCGGEAVPVLQPQEGGPGVTCSCGWQLSLEKVTTGDLWTLLDQLRHRWRRKRPRWAGFWRTGLRRSSQMRSSFLTLNMIDSSSCRLGSGQKLCSPGGRRPGCTRIISWS